MYRRSTAMRRGERRGRGMVPILERRTIWHDGSPRSSSRYTPESMPDRYRLSESDRRNNFPIQQGVKVSESISSSGRTRHRYREQQRLDNNNDLSRMVSNRISSSSTAPRNGPSMEEREYLERELAKRHRERDEFVALERIKNEEIRLRGEASRNVNRISGPEYGSGHLESYRLQTESQAVAEENARNISNSGMANWRVEDLLEGQSVLNAHSIQNAQLRIANDTSLSPAQVARARELLQELLITITTKPEMPIAGGDIPPEMRPTGYMAQHGLQEDKRSNFVSCRRIPDYTPPHSFSPRSNVQSTVQRDSAIRLQSSLPAGTPLTIPTQNSWSVSPVPVYPTSHEMSMSARDLPETADFNYGSRNDYPVMDSRVYMNDNNFKERKDKERAQTLLTSEKPRQSSHHERRRISRSRSRSLGKINGGDVTRRQIHVRSRNYIDNKISHMQKEFGRDYLPHEVNRRHHGESSDRRTSRHLPLHIRVARGHKR